MTSPFCSFEGCGKPLEGRGYCVGHYTQLRRGQTLRKLKADMTLTEKLMSHVQKTDGCWGWDVPLTSHKYPQLRVGSKTIEAHRVSYELHHGPIEPGMDIDHTCRNTVCVNPEHLQMVTRRENQENRNGAQSNSKSGVRGVFWNTRKRKYIVCVGAGGRKHQGGSFDSIEDAEEAAIALRNSLHTNNLADRMARTNQGEAK